jgi:hypothetical protein
VGHAHGDSVSPKAPAAPKPWTSGFCNATLPRTAAYDPHQRCPGCTGCRATNCPCNPEEPAVLRPEIPDPPEAPPTPSDQVEKCATDPGDAATPEDCVAAIRAATDRLSETLLAYAPDHWHDAARLLDALRKATARLGALDASLVQWLYLHGEHGLHQQVDGIAGPVNITRGRSKERWAAPEAIGEYVDRKMVELGGEVPDPTVVVTWVLEVLPATQSSSLRKTPLRQAGIDLDDFYWSEPGSLQVGLPKPDLTS